jgi:hypothetical protein
MNDADQAEMDRLRLHLIEQTGCQSEWRAQRAEEFPEDARNQQSADSLRRLAENLQALPPDHAIWFRLWSVYNGPAPSGGGSEFTEVENEHLRLYGFHEAENGNALVFLTAYIEELESRRLHVHDSHGPVK